MMRILQLIDMYKTGGAEKVFDAFNIFCKSHDYINDTYSVYKSKNANHLNFFIEENTSNLIKKTKQQIQATIALRKILNINRYDRVVSFLDRANLIGILACKKCKIPITVTVHNPPTVQYKKIGFMKNIVFILLRHFYNQNYVKVIAVSKQVKNSLLSIGIHKTTIIYNPIEIDKNKLQIHFNEFGYFLAIGRLNYQKGFWKLIKAVRVLKDEYHKNPKLIILGEGEQKDKLETLIKNMKLESNIKLFGYIENPLPIINNAKCIVFSSFYEGFPIVLLESYLLKKAVIGTSVSVPEEIRNIFEDNDFFYTNEYDSEDFCPLNISQDEIKLAEILNKAIEKNDILIKMAQDGYNWVRKNCNINNFYGYLNMHIHNEQ